MKNCYFPLFMNLNQKNIVVWGAGTIATPRIIHLLRFGATVHVIAPEFSKELEEIRNDYENQLFLEQRGYQEQDLERLFLDADESRETTGKDMLCTSSMSKLHTQFGCRLPSGGTTTGSPFCAIAATGNAELNQEITKACHKKGILVNNISDKSQSDFYFSALIEEGDILAGMISPSGNHRRLRQTAASVRAFLKQEEERCLVVETKGLGAKEGSENELVKLLEQKGRTVDRLIAGRIEIVHYCIDAKWLGQMEWLIFTSKNGVQGFFQNLLENGMDMRVLAGAKIAVIGEATAKKLADAGIKADFVPAQFDSKAFAEEFRQLLQKETKVLYIQNEASHHPLTQELRAVCDLSEMAVYKNVEAQECRLYTDEELLGHQRIYFTNAKSIERTLKGRSEEVLHTISERQLCYVIGPACRKELTKLGIKRVHMAEQATYQSLSEQ